MPQFRGQSNAFGFPGAPATWTYAKKQGFGTALERGSPTWFTIAQGILTEVFYPRTDTPQLRDLEFLFADEDGLFLEEKRDLDHKIERLSPATAYRIVSSDRNQRFTLTKEIIASPVRPCVLMQVELKGQKELLDRLKLFVLCGPHLQDAGAGNNAHVVRAMGREILAAEKHGTWLAIGASCKFSRLSCGYVGASDGFTDLSKNHRMTLEFDQALGGNVALTAQLDLPKSRIFVLGLAFGESLEGAVSSLFQSLSVDFEAQRHTFVETWERVSRSRKRLEGASTDGGGLYQSSYSLLLAAEDKRYQGAFVASPATPWGEARGDEHGIAGYHVVWTRDMVEVSMALLAAGDTHTPLRALINLAARQDADGAFTQNSWVDGRDFRKNIQLDEVAFPILLATRLYRDRLLDHFDPLPMVKSAANFLLHRGPVTGEERWEERSGYSPSTLATIIAACVCAGVLLREEHEETTARLLEEYADFLRAHLEEWTVTSQGSLSGSRYFVRINPAKPGEIAESGAVDQADLDMSYQPPGSPQHYPARNVVDAGFLQLVRYGILSPRDPLIVDSLEVVDQVLLVKTPPGKCWRRYNHDSYGQKPDGQPFDKWGVGGAWPLLTGERAHYEIAAGGNYRELIRAMEQFAKPHDLLPEQVWQGPDHPEAGLLSGRPTGSARPLLWAHAEYIRLLRSASDGKVFDLVPEVANRYLKDRPQSLVEYWLPMHPIRHARRDCILRICAAEPFRVRWSEDHWATWSDGDSSSTAIGAEFSDLKPSAGSDSIEFTFFWTRRNRWEGRNYKVDLE